MKGVYIDKNNVNIRIRVGAEVESYLYRDTPAEKFVKFLKRNDPVSFSVKQGTNELTFCSKIKDPDEFPEGYQAEEPTAPPQSKSAPASPASAAPPAHKDFTPANQIKTPAPPPQETSYIPDDGTLVAMSTFSDGYWKAKFLKDIRVQKEIRAQAALNTATNIVSQWRDKDTVKPNELGRLVMEIATDLQAYVYLSSHGDVDEPIEDWAARMRKEISKEEKKSDQDPDPKKPGSNGNGPKVYTNIPSSGRCAGSDNCDMDFAMDADLAGC